MKSFMQSLHVYMKSYSCRLCGRLGTRLDKFYAFSPNKRAGTSGRSDRGKITMADNVSLSSTVSSASSELFILLLIFVVA